VATRYQRLFFIPRGGMPQGQGEMPEQEQAAQGQEAPQGEQSADFDFDSWLGEQPEHVRGGYERTTGGLKSALEQERSQRKELAKELKRLGGLAEQGSEAQKALGEMSTRLEQAEQRAAFYEEANKSEIGCSNPKAAFLVAQAEGLFRRSGEPDWAAIKASAPELFGRKTPTPPGHAGNGNNAPPTPAAGMNAYIRQAAGRG
jgi:hypothetical protein